MKNLLHLWPVVVAFLVGYWLGPIACVAPSLTHLPGDPIDNRFNHYILEHGYRHGTPKRFWHAPMYFPIRNTVAGSENHLGTLPLYALLRGCGAEPERAFQGWYLILSAANFLTFVIAARWLGVGWCGAAVGAYLFAFGLPAISQMTHVQMVPRLFVPLAVAFAWRVWHQPSPWVLAGLVGSVVAQLYCCIYLGLLTLGLLAAFVPLVWLFAGRPNLQIPWRWRLAIVLPALGAIAYLMLPYVKASRTNVSMSREHLVQLTPEFAAWLRPPAASITWSWLRTAHDAEVPYEWEKQLFPGGLAVLAFGWGVIRLIRGDRSRVAILSSVLLLSLLLFAEWNGRSVYNVVNQLPGVEKLRAIGRVSLVLMVPFGLLAGSLVDRLTRDRAWLKLLAIGLAVMDHAVSQSAVPHYDLAASRANRQAWSAAVRAEPNVSLLYLYPKPGTGPSDGLDRELDAMWASLETGIPTVNGYTGYQPKNWFKFTNASDMLHWLRVNGHLSDELIGRLLTFGPPHGMDELPQEQQFRARIRNLPNPR